MVASLLRRLGKFRGCKTWVTVAKTGSLKTLFSASDLAAFLARLRQARTGTNPAAHDG